jgi:2-keto-4-pentenoate hydratase
MDKSDYEAAAERLAAARLERRPVRPLPTNLAPETEDEAYAVQEAVEARLTAAGWGRRVGYKIAATNPPSQAMLGRSRPCYGGILARNLLPSPAAVRLGRFVRLGVEVEIAMRIEADIPPEGAPWSRDALAERVAACLPALEVVDDRYQDFRTMPPMTLIADGAFQGAVVTGDECSEWRKLDLAALASAIAVDGEVRARGRGADTMGHPLDALAALANDLAGRGRGLLAGEIVLTGSIAAPQWPDRPARVTASVEGLGEVSLELLA